MSIVSGVSEVDYVGSQKRIRTQFYSTDGKVYVGSLSTYYDYKRTRATIHAYACGRDERGTLDAVLLYSRTADVEPEELGRFHEGQVQYYISLWPQIPSAYEAARSSVSTCTLEDTAHGLFSERELKRMAFWQWRIAHGLHSQMDWV